MQFDAPLQSVNSSVIVCMATPTTSRTISNVTDDVSGSYFLLQQTGGTNNNVGGWIAKDMESKNPTISMTLSASCTGVMGIMEVVDLAVGDTLAKLLDPSGYSARFTTSGTQNINQYITGDFAYTRTPDQLQLVLQVMNSGATATPSTGWTVQQLTYLVIGWRFSGAPGAIAGFQAFTTSSSTSYYNVEVMISMTHNALNNYAFASAGDGMSVSRD